MADSDQREFLDSAVLSRLSRLSLGARHPMIGTVTGIHKSATRGSSVEFAEYRKYVPGDDVRHIDWRVFARSDRYYMKEFEADTNLRCAVLFDASASMNFNGGHGSKFEMARKMAATLSYLLVNQGDAVGITCFNNKTVEEIPPRRTPSHLKSIFDTLAGMKPAGPTELVQVLHDQAEKIRSRALVVIFSDCFTEVPPLLDAFQHMKFRNHDLVVFHLLDRQEVDFKFDRPIRFMDMESHFSLVTDPSIAEAGYKDALHKYLDDIQRGCREFHVDYHRVFSDDDYEKVLAAFLLARMNKKKGSGR